MADYSAAELQRQTLEMLRAQQEAYLKAVRAWRDAMGGAAAAPQWPDMPMDTLPNVAEVAEASAAFSAKVLEAQSRFMKELSETLGSAGKKR